MKLGPHTLVMSMNIRKGIPMWESGLLLHFVTNALSRMILYCVFFNEIVREMNVYGKREGKPANRSHNNLVRQTHYGRGFMKSVSGLEKQANKLLQGSQESSALSLSILKRWAPKHRVKARCILGALSVCQ